MKYIDADLLRKEIKRLERAAHKSALGCADSETRKFHEGKDFAYQHIGILIDSLQQEQEQYVIGGQVFGATDVNQLYEGKVYIISNLVQDTEFGLSVRDKVKMLLIKD